MVPPNEMKKLLPLGMMFFCILFNYTILRNTKDVLVVTAPGAGAEIIPFLKTYVQLPGAIAFTVVYSTLFNKLSPDKVGGCVGWVVAQRENEIAGERRSRYPRLP